MSILRDLQEHLRDDFDRELSACEEYNKAEERLLRFIESELPPDKLGEIKLAEKRRKAHKKRRFSY